MLQILLLVFTLSCVYASPLVSSAFKNDNLPIDHVESLSGLKVTGLPIVSSNGEDIERLQSGEKKPVGITFSSFGTTFDFQDMELYTLGTDETEIKIHNNGNEEILSMQPTTYRSLFEDSNGEDAFALFTFVPNTSSFYGVIKQDGDIIRVLSQDHVLDRLTASAKSLISTDDFDSENTGLVAFKNSAIQFLNSDGEASAQCGGILVPPKDGSSSFQSLSELPVQMTNITSQLSMDPLHLGEDVDEHDSTVYGERNVLLKRWTNCFSSDPNLSYLLNAGFISDVGFFNRFLALVNGRTEEAKTNVIAYMQNMISYMNNIYLPQMGFAVSLREYVMKTSLDNVPFNHLGKYEAGSVCYPIDRYLDDLVLWAAANNPKKYGIWHALTNCYPPPGVVGLAYIGSTCDRSGYGTGVSSYSAGFENTVVHEIGHNIGSRHAWEYGAKLPRGKTGGCMDYNVGCTLNSNDPDNPRQLGFHGGSRDPICTHLRSTMTLLNIGEQKCWSPMGPQYEWVFGSYGTCSTTCGKGTRTRSVVCKETKGGPTADDSKCYYPKPATTEPCQETSTCTYSWELQGWRTCPSRNPCTKDISTRSVLCKRSDGSFTIDSFCTGPMPVTRKVCVGDGICTDAIRRRENSITDASIPDTAHAGNASPTVRWGVNSASVSPILISIERLNDPNFSMTLASSTTGSISSTVNFDNKLGAGTDYFIRLTMILPDKSKKTDITNSFEIKSPCATMSCLNGATCDAQNAQCICKTGYSGSTCSESKCKGVTCRSGSCDLISGRCSCPIGWNDPFCKVSNKCASQSRQVCGGQGFLESSDLNATCPTTCTCFDKWSPQSNCSSCSLQCNGHKTDGNCKRCVCGTGAHGESCECRSVALRFTVYKPAWISSRITPRQDTIFRTSLLAELSSLMKISPDYLLINELSISSHDIAVELFVSSSKAGCKFSDMNLSPMILGENEILSLDTKDRDMSTAYTACNNLKSSYSSDKENTSLEIYPLMSTVDRNKGVEMDDPNCSSGSDCPSNIDGKDEDNGLAGWVIIVIIVVSVTIALIFLIIIICCCCCACCRTHRRNQETKTMEMRPAQHVAPVVTVYSQPTPVSYAAYPVAPVPQQPQYYSQQPPYNPHGQPHPQAQAYPYSQPQAYPQAQYHPNGQPGYPQQQGSNYAQPGYYNQAPAQGVDSPPPYNAEA